jgi:hypothetical protein
VKEKVMGALIPTDYDNEICDNLAKRFNKNGLRSLRDHQTRKGERFFAAGTTSKD